jgi:hypothetical protein
MLLGDSTCGHLGLSPSISPIGSASGARIEYTLIDLVCHTSEATSVRGGVHESRP